MVSITIVKLSSGLRRLLLVLGTLFFLMAFHLVYVAWLNPVYGYLGFGYPAELSFWTLWSYVLAVLPSFWMPIELRRPSQFLHWMIYVISFAPSMLVLNFMTRRPAGEVGLLQLTLFTGMVLIGASYRIKTRRIGPIKVSPSKFWIGISVIAFCLFVRVVTVYWGKFEFVTWDRVYEGLRFTGSDIADAAGLAYPINWLGMVFFPFFSAVALLQRRPILFGLIAAGNVLLYMTQGMKHILFSSGYVFLMFLLLERNKEAFGIRFVWAIFAFFAAFFIYVFGFNAAFSALAIMLGNNVVMRVFATPGLLLGVYQDFLTDHPLTYYSHLTGVNRFISYPYERALGLEVGFATAGEMNYNMNAGFWVIDGLAAIGLPGIVAISLVVAGVFYLVDCLTSTQRAAVVALCLAQYAAIPLINISFFSGMTTGGFIFFILFFLFMPPGILDGTRGRRRGTMATQS